MRARLDLRPYASDDRTWWIASDTGPTAAAGPLRPDHVLGVGGAATMLTQATIRRPVTRLLDLGAGCGIQTLHALHHSRQVVASDLSARCLRFAAFNAALNEPDASLDLRRGDLLEPVAGELFDQVSATRPGQLGAPARRGLDRTGDELAPGRRDRKRVGCLGGPARGTGSGAVRRDLAA